MFTTGRLIFTISFLIVFIVVIAYSYRKDLKVNRMHFKGNVWILVTIVLIFSTLFLLVKFRN